MYFKTESDLKASKMLENEFTPKLLQRDSVFVKNNCISLDKTFPVWMAIVLTSYQTITTVVLLNPSITTFSLKGLGWQNVMKLN